MEVLREDKVALRTGRQVRARFLRASGEVDSLLTTLVDIDMSSFIESTLTRAMAEVLLHHGQVFLLEIDGEFVGRCLCLKSWALRDEAVLSSVGLLPGWRGRGLGLKMVSWLVDTLRDEGMGSLALHVGHHNRRAVALYRELGFQEVARVRIDAVTGEESLLLRCTFR